MNLKIRMGLDHKMELPHKLPNPLLGLSPLELELLLEQSLVAVRKFDAQDPAWNEPRPIELRKNYFGTHDFSQQCESVRGSVPKEKYLEMPQIVVQKESEYVVRYNADIQKRLQEKLDQFKRREDEKPRVNQIFSKRFMRQREWIVAQQLSIVEYLCKEQDTYLQRGNPFDLKSISREDVATVIDCSASSVARLVTNLSVQLPNTRVIFTEELIPGQMVNRLQGVYALRQLQQEGELYHEGKWRVADRELVPILYERFKLEVARRTVAKYKSLLQE